MADPGQLLGEEFLKRPVLEVAPELLGCYLCRELDGKILRWRITEVEAYDGPEDKACHAHKGRTGRTEVMFGPAGHWYVYFCYGIHWLLNIVTGPEDYPAAVLIRGAGEISGPARLTKALSITGELNRRMAVPECGLWIEAGEILDRAHILTTPRIGVDYAGPDWSRRPYRFLLRES